MQHAACQARPLGGSGPDYAFSVRQLSCVAAVLYAGMQTARNVPRLSPEHSASSVQATHVHTERRPRNLQRSDVRSVTTV